MPWLREAEASASATIHLLTIHDSLFTIHDRRSCNKNPLQLQRFTFFLRKRFRADEEFIFAVMAGVDLKRLARELNLAVSTVSRALRDSHEISVATKERVKALADKYGFRPNPHASSLRQAKSRTIAVVVPEIRNNFFSQAINGIELVAQEKGYHVLIYLTHENSRQEREVVQLLQNGRADGLLISVTEAASYPHLEACREAGLPIVFFDRVVDGIDAPRVITDEESLAYQTCSRLLDSGCGRIAFLTMAGNLSISRHRQEGYLRALKERGKEHSAVIVECNADDGDSRKRLKQLLQEEPRPDAVFAAVEKLAVDTYEVCAEMGLAIPDDLCVAGFSNLTVASLFYPPLTTVVQPAYEIGKEAADILFRLIEGKKLMPGEQKRVLPSRLEWRGSTAR